jgi:putative radical SAM enzyme (TIGR03279 family)
MGQGLVVKEVIPESLASEAGLRPGDRILSINGHPLRDLIDLDFYQADGEVVLSVESGTEGPVEIAFEKDPDERLGLVVDPPPIKRCPNKCDFCFVDQMPEGQRKSLYIRDEDYRYSFLYGNFITLTNLSDSDYQRILDQRLSPLYISVHATDPKVRKRLLRNDRAPDVLKMIDRLTAGGIRLHTQVVITPGVNDGEVLERSVADLSSRYPGVSSLAIVPVGLTQHRSDLPEIDSIGKEFARKMIAKIDALQRPFLEVWDDPFVYPADEWYVIAGRSFPSLKRYGTLPQLGNGVGLVPLFQSQWKRGSGKLRSARTIAGAPRKEKRRPGVRFALATGTAFAPYLRRMVDALGVESPEWREVFSVLEVENGFFGDSVTVAGLLAGRDIRKAVLDAELPDGTMVLVPQVAVRNETDVFLDDSSVTGISGELGRRIALVPSDASGFWEWIGDYLASAEHPAEFGTVAAG